jgi:NADH:ubiquinone oxidoreductase subunit
MQYIRTYQKVGLKGLWNKLYTFRQLKEGTLIGADKFGNKYYENKDYPYGQHRWYEPPIPVAQQLWDASSIPPEWHGWMHYTTDRVPSPAPLPSGQEIVGETNVPKPLDTHQVPDSVRDGEWRMNQTLNRERGYGVKNMYQSQMGGNAFYTQPGNALSPVHKEFVPKVFEQAWTPGKGMMAKKPEPPSKFQKFKAEREAMNNAESKPQAVKQ